MSPSQIRNICIIAHIDHGKTTLTDRLLTATNTISPREFHDRLLDSNPIEQERGITIKLAPVRMSYNLSPELQAVYHHKSITINLIDTPGHVDFGYEVSRSLAACEGAILLVDATQGIQAQTLSNFSKAQALGLKIIVALNKIDLPSADIEGVSQELVESFSVKPEDIVHISAKTGANIDQLFQTIIAKIPPPTADFTKPLKALVFNSTYHPHKGVVAFVKVIDGQIATSTLCLKSSLEPIAAKEIGYFNPAMTPSPHLQAGQVGYVATGLKDVSKVKVGDTITTPDLVNTIEALPGYHIPQPVVYIDIYPVDGKEFMLLDEAIQKLALNDAALKFSRVSSQALGKGFRVGFLGALHAEIALERIKREHGLDLIPTAPTVVYQVTKTSGESFEVKNPAELPDPSLIATIEEPLASVTIYTPAEYIGAIITLTNDHRGELVNQTYLGHQVKMEYIIPLAELIINYFDKLKSVSQGYASLEYELLGYQPVDAVKLNILINKEPIEALSQIIHRSKAVDIGKRMVAKLKDAIPRSLIEIPIQAAIGGSVIARETIKAYRKDVTAKLYGGDITRRMKLLRKQKRGKERRSEFAKVDIPQSAYLAVLKQ